MQRRRVSAAPEEVRIAEAMRTPAAEEQGGRGVSEVDQALARVDRGNVPVVVLVDRGERDVLLAWGADAVVCLTRPPAPEKLVKLVKKLESAWPEELWSAPWPRE